VLIDPTGATAEIAGAERSTTNNRMEITAAIEALRRVPPGAAIAIHSDSQYVIKTMTLGWRRRENLDLWPLLDEEAARRQVTWEWVRGHSGDPLNERADELARSAAEVRPPRALPLLKSTTSSAPSRSGARTNNEKLDLIDRVTPLLEVGEEVRECRGCGRLFIANDHADFCNLASCQLPARSTGN
jgi:ribonuclease HI